MASINKTEPKKLVGFEMTVGPRSAGDFGWVHIGGVQWSESELKDMIARFSSGIPRHVDDARVFGVKRDYRCKFCDSPWEPLDARKGTPCCCEEAVAWRDSQVQAEAAHD